MARGWNAAENELILVTVPSGLNPNVRGNFTFNIAIEGIEALSNRTAPDALDNMSRIVEGILAGTEMMCRDLGFDLSQ
jgi:hypothetical protein